MPPRKKTRRGKGAVERSFDLTNLREASQLPANLLPSYGDIIRLSRFIRSNNYSRTTSVETIAKDVSKEVFGFWSSKVFPFFPLSSVFMTSDNCYTKVLKLLEKAKVLNWDYAKVDAFQWLIDVSEELFDLFHCRSDFFHNQN